MNYYFFVLPGGRPAGAASAGNGFSRDGVSSVPGNGVRRMRRQPAENPAGPRLCPQENPVLRKEDEPPAPPEKRPPGGQFFARSCRIVSTNSRAAMSQKPHS